MCVLETERPVVNRKEGRPTDSLLLVGVGGRRGVVERWRSHACVVQSAEMAGRWIKNTARKKQGEIFDLMAMLFAQGVASWCF